MNSQQPNEQGQDQPLQYSTNNSGGNLITPNSVAVLVLGILSITFCWCYGILSVILGIVALVMASSGEREYRLNPGAYSIASYKNLKAGKTCAIIGLCCAAIAIVCFIIYVVLVGSLALNLFNMGLTN